MIIKICGITDPQDAIDAAKFGADWVGILLSKKAKHFVSSAQGKEIAQAAREHGIKPIGVFVDEHADEILDSCANVGVNTVQLHGKASKQYIHLLLPIYELIFTLGVSNDGVIDHDDIDIIQTVGRGHKDLPSWMLFDCANSGTKFHPPFRCPWLLSGGITPHNVQEAISLLNPNGIEVSTSVEKPGTVRKDPRLVENLIRNVRDKVES